MMLDTLRRERQVIDIAERLAVKIHEDDLIDLVACEELYVEPHRIGWDVRRLFGTDDQDIYENVLAALGLPRDDIDSQWQSFDRERLPTDRLIVDVADDARALWGWVPSAELAAELDRLLDIADVRRAALSASEELEWQLAGDREHTAWAAERAARQKEIAELERMELEQEKFVDHVRTGAVPMPRGYSAPMPLLAGQEAIASLGEPLVTAFLAGQRGTPAKAHPRLPEAMLNHPLYESINLAIGHMVAGAPRWRIAPTDAVDVLGVLAAAHEATFQIVAAQVREMGCLLPAAKLDFAVRRFETRVMREVRIGAGWRTTPKGEVDPQNADNVAVFLRLVGVEARFNAWRNRIEIRAQGGEWQQATDAEKTRLRAIASQEEHGFRPVKEFLWSMIDDLARQTSFDPVRDFIDSAKWDGTPRLAIWLSRACGVPCDPYHQAVGTTLFGGIVRRARHPGCKHDFVPILISNQGSGKSSLCRILALCDSWFSDSVAFEGSPQNIVPQLFGKLVVELSELDGMHRRDVGHVKRFLSTQSDSVTLKYDAHASDHARRCVFIGTCNLENPLVDDTGNRRFYPVRIPDGFQIDLDWMRANVDQLVAEAAHREANGDTFAIPREIWATASTVQEAARSVSAVEELLLHWFSKPDVPGCAGYYVLSADIVQALKMSGQSGDGAKTGAAMKRLGYVDRRVFVGGAQKRAWIKSPDNGINGCLQLEPMHKPMGGVEMRIRSAFSTGA